MIESVEVTVQRNGQVERMVPLRSGSTRMGRAEDNDLVLSDVGVSRYHAQITVNNDEVVVEDLGSGNGTYYFGHRVKAQPVRDGDEIVIDPFVLRFRIEGAITASLPPVRANSGVRLEVLAGPGMAGSSYPIGERGLTMGRAEDRDVVIPDPASSRHHCHIEPVAGEYVLYDNGSANGVFVNSVRVRECTLTDGDIVRIGNTEMRFVRFDGAASGADAEVPADVWNPQAGNAAYGVPATNAPIDAYDDFEEPASGGSSILAIFSVVGLMLCVGALGVVLLGAFVGYTMWSTAVPITEPTPPRWSISLPDLPAADPDALFNKSVDHLKAGEEREALMQLYRVLQADPGNTNAEKFVLVAGQRMLLDALEEPVVAADKKRKAVEAERTALIARAKRGGRSGRNARREVIARFGDDAAVREALDYAGSKPFQEREALLKAAQEAAGKSEWTEAGDKARQLLDQAYDPKLRTEAIAVLRKSETNLADQTAADWFTAVNASIAGDDDAMRSNLQQVLNSDPANVGAKLRLERQ